MYLQYIIQEFFEIATHMSLDKGHNTLLQYYLKKLLHFHVKCAILTIRQVNSVTGLVDSANKNLFSFIITKREEKSVKERYQEAHMEAVYFEVTDIITTSGVVTTTEWRPSDCESSPDYDAFANL